MNSSRTVCVIPARGGSKRIPRKNIISFHGKPMIAWTIEAAINSKIFDKVIVSTDDEEIASISIKYGAEVPFLREAKNDDFSPISEATIHTLNQFKEKLNQEWDTVVQLMANCPLRTTQDISSAIENFVKNDLKFQISAFKYGWMNPWWAYKIRTDGSPEPVFPGAISTRSQDLPKLFCPTGAIWIANIDALKKSSSFYGQDFKLFEMDWVSAIDIDDMDDFMLAEASFELRRKKAMLDKI